MKQRTDDRLWNIQEVATFLHVEVGAVYRMTRRDSRNPIPHIKLGNRLRFRRTDIEQWLDLFTVSPLETLTVAKGRAVNLG